MGNVSFLFEVIPIRIRIGMKSAAESSGFPPRSERNAINRILD